MLMSPRESMEGPASFGRMATAIISRSLPMKPLAAAFSPREDTAISCRRIS